MTTSGQKNGATPGLRILLVDDEPSILRMFRSALANYGYATELAGSLDEAMLLLEMESFDVVVSDVNMPGGSGFDLLLAVRRRGLAVPFLIMTGKPPVDFLKKAAEAGAWRAVIKPVMPPALRDLVEAMVAEGRQRLAV
jgi:DNA-binding NtrC family response regulator